MSKKRTGFNYIILAIILAYNVVYKFIIEIQFRNEETIITSVFFILLFLVSVGMYGFAKSKLNPLKKNVTKTVILIVVIGIVLTYVVGYLIGFIKNGYSLKPLDIIKNITIPLLLIIFTELFRYNSIRANKDNFKHIVLLTFFITLLEIQTNIVIINRLGLREIFVVTTTVILPISVKNIMLSYIDYEIGYQPCLIYRILLEISGFLLPYLPNLGDYMSSLFGFGLPLIVYIYSSNIVYEGEEINEKDFQKSKVSRVLDIVAYGTVIIVIALISRLFPIFVIGIGSESMTGAINKGDAVIAYKVSEDKIHVNDVIVFQTRDKVLIHRVVEIEDIDGTRYYRTKGDANRTRDNINVTASMIYGKVKFKIPFVAYPSVWLSAKMKQSR